MFTFEKHVYFLRRMYFVFWQWKIYKKNLILAPCDVLCARSFFLHPHVIQCIIRRRRDTDGPECECKPRVLSWRERGEDWTRRLNVYLEMKLISRVGFTFQQSLVCISLRGDLWCCVTIRNGIVGRLETLKPFEWLISSLRRAHLNI